MGAKKSNRPDRRTLKTQRQLKESLVKLLARKSIDKISVAELARDCDIGRGTFYIHYKDVYDLYDAVVADTIEQLTKIFEELYPRNDSNDFAPLAKRFVTFIVDHEQIFDALTNHGKDIQILKKISSLVTYHVVDIEQVDTTSTRNMAVIQFASYGMVGIITDWLAKEQQAHIDDLIEVVTVSIEAVRSLAQTTCKKE